MSNSEKQLSTDELLDELERRAQEHANKADNYRNDDKDDQREAWFKGLATGYRGAKELIEDGE